MVIEHMVAQINLSFFKVLLTNSVHEYYDMYGWNNVERMAT